MTGADVRGIPWRANYSSTSLTSGFLASYNITRRHSGCEMLSPVAYEALLAKRAAEVENAADAA